MKERKRKQYPRYFIYNLSREVNPEPVRLILARVNRADDLIYYLFDDEPCKWRPHIDNPKEKDADSFVSENIWIEIPKHEAALIA